MIAVILLALALNLEQAEETAMKYNKAILLTKQEEIQSKYRRLQSVAAYLPKITYSYVYAKMEKPLDLVPVRQSTTLNNNQVVLTQPVFSTDLIFGLKASKHYWDRSKADNEIAINTVLYQTRLLYYGVVLNQQSVQVEQEVMGYLQEALGDQERKYEAGKATTFDVNQCKVALSSAKSAYHTYLKDLRSSKNALIFDLGIDTYQDVDVTETEVPLDKYPLLVQKIALVEAGKETPLFSEAEIQGWFSAAKQNRPELKKTKAIIRAVKEEGKAKKGKFLPSVSAFVDYGYFIVENGLPFKQQNNWIGGIQLNWTIFDSFKREFQIAEATFLGKAADLGYLQEMDRMETDIRTTTAQMEEAIYSYLASKDAFNLAKQSMDEAKVRLSAGTITPLQFRDATKSYAEARLQANRSGFNLLQYYYQLCYNIGQPHL